MLDINQIMQILPHRYPFLLIDKVTNLVLNESIEAYKNVTIGEPIFEGHFPGHPIYPGVMIIEGMAQAGGVLAFRDKGLFWKKFSDFNEDGSVKTDVGILLKVKQISSYGNDSYGGMSGRDIMALAAGLYEASKFDYLDARVKQCEYLAQGFYKAGVKGVVLPAGGHGVYINMDEFFDNKRSPETFAGQGFSVELIRRYGIRTAELGNYSMEYDLKTPEQQAEVANVVRFAVNRSMYSKEHLDYVIAAVKALYEDRESIPNMRITKGHNLPMRHFHAFLEPYPNEEK